MKFGLDVPTTGAYADARVQAQLALEAEAAGWDGFFIWDTLLGAEAIIDPWIALTAIALHTSHIKIGLLALPLPRHEPRAVAGQLANLDQLSTSFIAVVPLATKNLVHLRTRFFVALLKPEKLLELLTC